MLLTVCSRVHPVRLPDPIPAPRDAHRQCSPSLHGPLPPPPPAHTVGAARQHPSLGSTPAGLHREGGETDRSRQSGGCCYHTFQQNTQFIYSPFCITVNLQPRLYNPNPKFNFWPLLYNPNPTVNLQPLLYNPNTQLICSPVCIIPIPNLISSLFV